MRHVRAVHWEGLRCRASVRVHSVFVHGPLQQAPYPLTPELTTKCALVFQSSAFGGEVGGQDWLAAHGSPWTLEAVLDSGVSCRSNRGCVCVEPERYNDLPEPGPRPLPALTAQ